MAKKHDKGYIQKTPASARLDITSGSVTVVASGTVLNPVPGKPDVKPFYVPKIEIGSERFNESFGKICKLMEEASTFGSPDQPGFYAAEIELHLEVMAGGDLRILGSGLEPNATGGIRVVFRRGKQGLKEG